jgi:hypothetical protein
MTVICALKLGRIVGIVPVKIALIVGASVAAQQGRLVMPDFVVAVLVFVDGGLRVAL